PALPPGDRARHPGNAPLMARPPARAAVRLLSLLVPLAGALAAWWPLVDNYFYNDDFIHLFDVVTLPLPHLLTQIWGGHLYVVRNAVFAGMYAVFGPEPRPWFTSVLLTHLVNVLLLHRLVLRLTGDLLLACLGATLWGTAPVLEGALGWYAVYGQVLLATIVLAVVSSLATAVARDRPPSRGQILAWAGLLAAGATCFGIGLGIVAGAAARGRARARSGYPRRDGGGGSGRLCRPLGAVARPPAAGARAHVTRIGPGGRSRGPDSRRIADRIQRVHAGARAAGPR